MLSKAVNFISWFFYFLGVGGFFSALLVLIVLLIKNPYFLAEDICLDGGQVWDGDEKRCREDCLTWNKDYGCIKMTEEQVGVFAKFRNRERYIPIKVYKEICLNNQKAWDNDQENCLFEFRVRECNTLKGNWEYPEICNTQKINP